MLNKSCEEFLKELKKIEEELTITEADKALFTQLVTIIISLVVFVAMYGFLIIFKF